MKILVHTYILSSIIIPHCNGESFFFSKYSTPVLIKWWEKKKFQLDDWWQDYLIKNRHAEIWIKKPLPDDWVPNPIKAFRTPET